MAGFLKRTKTDTVNPAGGINPASSPNAGQYGWTSYDAGNVNQIIEYVNMAKDAAQLAKDAAEYVQDKYSDLQNFINYIQDIYEQINPIFTNIELIYKDVVKKYDEIIIIHNEVTEAVGTVTVLAGTAADNANAAADSATAASGFADDAEASATSSEVSNVGSKSWYDKSYDLYLDLKSGQVYRGVWDPTTNAYPDFEGTNSVWDVVLPAGTIEHSFSGKMWHGGDRLIYVVATSMYDQITAGSTVTSVNTKTGAVTLDYADVNAVGKTGDQSMTGKLTAKHYAATDPYAYTSSKQRLQGMYLSSVVGGDCRTIIGGGGAAVGDATGSVYIRPNGISDIKGETRFLPSGSIHSPTAPTSDEHLTNRKFVDTRVNAVADTVQPLISLANNAVPNTRTVNGKALNADITLSHTDVGALPIAGGTVTGPINFGTGGTVSSPNTNIMEMKGSNYSFVTGVRGAHLCGNSYWDGTNWLKYDVSKPSMHVAVEESGEFKLHASAATATSAIQLKPLTVDINGNAVFKGEVKSGRNLIANDNYAGMELLVPGKHAAMVYVDKEGGNMHFTQSDGAGTGLLSYANFNPAALTFYRHSNFASGINADGLVQSQSGFRVNAVSPVMELHSPGVAAYAWYIQGNGTMTLGQTNGAGSVAKNIVTIDTTGNMSLPSATLYFDGSLTGTIWGGPLSNWCRANFAPISDRDLKRNIQPATKSALEDVSKIDFVSYDWDETNPLVMDRKSPKIGLTAQHMEEIDECYSRDINTFNEDGTVKESTKALDVTNMLALALKAIQEQQDQIDELKEKLNEFILK